MVRAIVSALLLVILAVLVSFNLGFTATISLFGVRFEGVPVMAIALLSFAVGVVYSLFLFIGRSLHQRKRQGLAMKARDLAERERALDDHPRDRESRPPDSAAESAAGDKSAQGQADSEGRPGPKERKGLLDRLKSIF
jgi:uncharacterized integral membrane protein